MKQTNTDFIIVGKIGSTHGVHGWLKICSYGEQGTQILAYSPWYLSIGHLSWREVNVEDGRVQGNKLIAKLIDINSLEEARLLTGKSIAITRSQLPKLKENEYYWLDLIGLTVINKHGRTLGKVVYLMTTGSNDVLVIKNNKEHAIPFLFGDVILNVDLVKQQILVDWELT